MSDEVIKDSSKKKVEEKNSEIKKTKKIVSDISIKEPKSAPKEISPVTDLRETLDEFFVAVELPGLRRKDVSVKLNINEMEIRGNKRRLKGLKKENDTIHEIEDGVYVRKISLPDTVQPKKARISIKNGLLIIIIPKKNYEEPISISVK